MRRRLVSAFAVACIWSAAASPATAADFPSQGVALLERWTNAVSSHTSGRLDEALDHVLAFTYQDRRLLDTPMRTFVSILSGREYTPGTALERKVDALARGSLQRFGYLPFLKRAVMLHTDVAIAGERTPQPLVRALPPLEKSTSPLLATRRMTVSRDGEVVGDQESDWNWPFARSLADAIHLATPADPFVGEWYHATAAYMFSRLLHAEVTVHLSSATRILPDDARILFDRGSYADALSLPAIQSLLRGADPFALRAIRQGQRPPRSSTNATRAAAGLDLPMKHEALADADTLFRRALRADPSFVEARVRLARGLIERGRYDEALAEIGTALAGKPSGDISFYAHLFGGRAAQAMGRFEDAVRHFDAALELFPAAQSAMLARSQLALIGADVTTAVGTLERLPKDPRPDVLDDDPWVYYRLAIGREWDSLYRALRIQ